MEVLLAKSGSVIVGGLSKLAILRYLRLRLAYKSTILAGTCCMIG